MAGKINVADDAYIANLRAQGASLQEIADSLGVSLQSVWRHDQTNRKNIKKLKSDLFLQYIGQSLDDLDYLQTCMMAEFEKSGEKSAKLVGCILDIIRERSNLLDLPGFTREQRAKDGNAPRLVLHEDDAGIYAEPENEPELDDASTS